MNGDPDLLAIQQSHTVVNGRAWHLLSVLRLCAVIQLPCPLRDAQNLAQGTPFYGMVTWPPVRSEKKENQIHAML